MIRSLPKTEKTFLINLQKQGKFPNILIKADFKKLIMPMINNPIAQLVLYPFYYFLLSNFFISKNFCKINNYVMI